MEQIIGIDPDLEKSGIAIIVNNKLELLTFNLPTLLYTFFKNLVKQQDENYTLKTTIYVEAAYLVNHFFQPVKASPFVISKINRNIGENHAIAKAIIQSAKACGLNVVPCYPVTSTNYRNRGKKITHPQFLNMLQRNGIHWYGDSSNQETRDAALIAVTYGINKEYHEGKYALNNSNQKSNIISNEEFTSSN